MIEWPDLSLPPACSYSGESTPCPLASVYFSCPVPPTRVQREFCSQWPVMWSNSDPRQTRREWGWEGREGWIVYSSIQHQKIIKRDSNSGPNELGLVFLPSAGGLFSEPSRVRSEFPRLPAPWGLAPPSPAAWGPPHSQGDGRRSRRTREIWPAQRRSQGVRTQPGRGEGGRRRVECLYRDQRATSFSFAALSDHG